MTTTSRLRFVIDIDGVICKEIGDNTFENVRNAVLIQDAKEAVNGLYNSGNTVVLYTARRWNLFEDTKKWLDDNGVLYHTLLCGKPASNVWIDDRAFRFTDWKDILEKIKDVEDDDLDGRQ